MTLVVKGGRNRSISVEKVRLNVNFLSLYEIRARGGPLGGARSSNAFFLATEVAVKMIIKMVSENSTLVYVCGIL